MIRKEFLPLSKPDVTDEDVAAVEKVLRSGWWTTGPVVAEFEKGIADYVGEGVHSVALNSCTAGLFLSLLAHGVGKGDEVIVPTWTFAATAHVVLWTGAMPVPCDVYDASLNIDIEKMESLIGPKTKAVIPVHYAGYPCDMDRLIAVARRREIVVIEDAAHAIGTSYKGRKVGSLGDITAFSFYATKNLACGEGGMVVSKDRSVMEKIRKLSYFGINKTALNRYAKAGSWFYDIEELGYKFNMDNIHAAIGLAQLERLDRMNLRRREIASIYRRCLDSRIKFMEDNGQSYHTYHLFPIRIKRDIIGRDAFVESMKKRYIGTSVHFIPLHLHSYYKKLWTGCAFPVADKAYEEMVSIPMFPGMSDEDVRYVIDNTNDILKNGG